MVRFFNQKEEVLNIELTPYGRQRFASGSFAPAFYAFYDNSIMYDGNYGGVTETQNQITNRISNQTPRLQPNTRFTSTPGSIFSLASAQTSADFLQNNFWNAPFNRVLGSSDPNSIYAPSWEVSVLNFGDVGFHDGVEYNTDNTIPQMSATLIIDYESESIPQSDNVLYSLVSSETIVLDMQELNTVFKNRGNFDIEVMVSGTDGRVVPLGFINDKAKNSIQLLSQLDPSALTRTINGSEKEITDGFPLLDSTYVEFYLDIAADNEISDLGIRENSSLYKSKIDQNPKELCAGLPDNIDINNTNI